jgi:dolichol-phosphate mannosyltransferase
MRAPAPGAEKPRLLSVIIPALNEEGSLAATVGQIGSELAGHGIPHEIILVVDERSVDRTWELAEELRSRFPGVVPVLGREKGYGRAVVLGFDRMSGDAAVVMMADGSDDPRDLAGIWEELGRGFDCVFASRFVRGGGTEGYPRRRLAVNRLANGFIRLLFGVALDDTTNAFKAYHREAIDSCRPFWSSHFELTVELPLKAIRNGFSWTVLPTLWRNRRPGASNLKLWEMAHRYLSVVLRVRFGARGNSSSQQRGES